MQTIEIKGYQGEVYQVNVEPGKVQGCEVLITAVDERWPKNNRRVYKMDGTPLEGNFKYGRTGTANHVENIFVNWRGELVTTTSGYQGATGRGWGGYLKNIIW